MKAKIVDPDSGKELAVNQAGELWVTGPNLMKGYHNNAKATAETIDADGWLHTGDVARVDENGLFYIVDRLKELIKYKGSQVAPAELEACLLENPMVADCAVIGVAHESAGEVPRAFVVKKSGSHCSAKQIEQFVKDRLSTPKWLRGGVVFVDAIPKSPSGKILRRVLRDAVRNGSIRVPEIESKL
ncbi:hypothetical protein HDU98_011715 [Podochytrium sp. JEL0797]|nr:hypothetical protein HDU98_011715 [Podochytrium sp. JEL0797]